MAKVESMVVMIHDLDNSEHLENERNGTMDTANQI
jgi:hypothetical protein